MNSHSELDKRYHAEIAPIYDYITNEPRAYPNELLFRPLDRLVRPAELMIDLGCGTGQMFLRYRHQAGRITAVDHSAEMLREARRKAGAAGIRKISFIEADFTEFLASNPGMKANLVTCVGVLHHLELEGLKSYLGAIAEILAEGGQVILAEPIYSDSVPRIVQDRNARSVLPARIENNMPSHVSDPDEEPLREADLLEAVSRSGLNISCQSKGFELFHVTDPISAFEKIMIRFIYWRYRTRGDVIALLLEK